MSIYNCHCQFSLKSWYLCISTVLWCLEQFPDLRQGERLGLQYPVQGERTGCSTQYRGRARASVHSTGGKSGLQYTVYWGRDRAAVHSTGVEPGLQYSIQGESQCCSTQYRGRARAAVPSTGGKPGLQYTVLGERQGCSTVRMKLNNRNF